MKHDLKPLPPRLSVVIPFTCPECGYALPIALSPSTLTGEYGCGNVDCRAHYRVKIRIPESQEGVVKTFRDQVLLSIHKLDAIDWSGASVTSERIGQFPDPR